VELTEDNLFVEPAKAGVDWLWHSDKIDNRTEAVLGYCLGEFVVEREKGRMRNMAGEVVPTALCGSLP
jgi:hypothetical protein